MGTQTFRVHVSQAILDDLQKRLARTRWPDEIVGAGWEYGSNLAYMKELVEYWRTRFDWRAQERAINAFAHYRAEVDGLSIHFIHERGKGPNPLPLILTHGWPSTFYEMLKIIPLLTDPAMYGGHAAEAFDVIVPLLPGYGFSGPTRQQGVNMVKIADLLNKLLTRELGYQRYGAHGGDWGAGINTHLAAAYPERVIGIHLSVTWFNARPEGQLTEDEQQLADQLDHWQREETGYAWIQGTKPQTLAYALTDSPTGLAAWIVEKWRAWSDCNGNVESRFSKDELLTNILIHWVTHTINSSKRLYYEHLHNPWRPSADDPVKVPTGVANFPKEPWRDFRRSVEKAYNIIHWSEMPRGGHFPAMEEPQLLAEDICDFFRMLR